MLVPRVLPSHLFWKPAYTPSVCIHMSAHQPGSQSRATQRISVLVRSCMIFIFNFFKLAVDVYTFNISSDVDENHLEVRLGECVFQTFGGTGIDCFCLIYFPKGICQRVL